MRTILIPVDSSTTSDNAARFAVSWAKQYGYTKIVLLKTFYQSMFELMIVSEGHSHVNQDSINEEREESGNRLNELQQQLSEISGQQISVETRTSELPLLRSINQAIEEDQPELIIVGSNFNRREESFIASQVIGIAKTSPVKVLVVPDSFIYQPVKNVLVPTDSKTLLTLEKLERLKKESRLGDAKLFILNVDQGKAKETADKENIEGKLHQFLNEFNHELYYVNDSNVLHGIMTFSEAQSIDLIIALPGKHSFLYYLTNTSISEAIYKNARLPVLILK